MTRPPGDLLAKADQPAGDTPENNRLLPEMNVARKMNFYAACKIKAALPWSLNDGGLVQSDHSASPLIPY